MGYLKLFRVISIMMVQTKCKQRTLSYSINCSIFRANKKETRSTTKTKENLKNGIVRFRLSFDVRKKSEGRLVAERNKNQTCVCKRT